MIKRDKLISRYAAKFAAETVSAEPPIAVDPTDEALAEVFKNCVGVPELDMLPKIRAAFDAEYEEQFSALRSAHTRTIAEQLDDAQSGDEFGQVLQGLFRVLETGRDEES